MTTTEAYKEICDYFNLEPLQHGKKKLMRILESVCTVKETIVIKEINPLPIPHKGIDYMEELRRISELYETDVASIMSRSGLGNVVSARVHFCRYVKINMPKVTSVSLAKFLNRNHSTIIYYWYHHKGICELPALLLRGYSFNEQTID